MTITKEDLGLTVLHCNKQLEVAGSPVRVMINGRYGYYAVELYTGHRISTRSLHVLRTGLNIRGAYNIVQSIADTLIYMKQKGIIFDYECEECEYIWNNLVISPCPKCGSKFTSTVEDD